MNNRTYDVLLARLRNGCADLNEFLYNSKKRDNPYCTHCPGTNETVEHYVLHCPHYVDVRLTLYNKLNSINIISNEEILQILLTGGHFLDKIRLKVLRLFIELIYDSKRFEYLDRN